ncbi:TetR family transcriptional regulator [Leptolyngbya sp. NIES-3755]|nr:TetR family transcriptional regulator [Leptolyngbya sp. NIES-3755]
MTVTSDRQTAKRDQILKGAMTVFLRSGYAGTSMDRIAAEAGVSKQTIYSHFQDKEGLFRSLIEGETLSRFQAVFQIDPHHIDPETLLRRLADIYFTQVVDHSHYVPLLRIVIAESERFPELAKVFIQTVAQRGKQLLCEYFRHHPELNIRDPEAIAQIFFGSMVSWVILQKMLHGESSIDLSRDRIVDQLIELIVEHSTRRKTTEPD